jgi:citrate synthase
MTQISIIVAALNTESKFAKLYEKGLNKADYWEPTFDDSIALLAKIPRVAALVFRPDEVDLVGKQQLDPAQDWSYNFAELLGKGGSKNGDFHDLLRLYLALHGDHEGGNVSAHATHLVGSALSDPYLSYSAGLLGLAGPLHGLAAQEVLRWILAMQDKIGTKFSDEDVRTYLWDTLKSGRVVPGYGHGVLRKPDPRFQALMDFAATRPDVLANPVFQLVKKNSEIAPGVLTEHGKVPPPSYKSLLQAHPIMYVNIILTINRQRTPTPTSTPPLVCSSTTTASSSHSTTLSPLVSAVRSDPSCN